jgi:hypothetical protein
MVDLSGLGVDANLSADLMLCLDIADKRHCFTNYQYGNKEDRVFATVRPLPVPTVCPVYPTND